MEKKFDLAERTQKFSIETIHFLKKIRLNHLNKPIIEQLIRSATGIGANYHEADSAESKKDFVHKLGIAKKEARETVYWLNLLSKTDLKEREPLEKLSGEARELFLILTSIINKSRV
jgi:four helix bundle protein